MQQGSGQGPGFDLLNYYPLDLVFQRREGLVNTIVILSTLDKLSVNSAKNPDPSAMPQDDIRLWRGQMQAGRLIS